MDRSFLCDEKFANRTAEREYRNFEFEMALLTYRLEVETAAHTQEMRGANECFARVRLRKRKALARLGYPRLTAWASFCRASGAELGGN